MPTKGPSGSKFEEGWSHKGVELNSGLNFGGKRLGSLKAGAHWEWAPFFETTLHGSEWRLLILLRHPLKGDIDVDIDEAVKQTLVEMEAEEQDPLEGMGNAQIAEIYRQMKPEDQRLFRQFKRFHKRYYETHGHDPLSHQLTRGIVQQMFPGLPSANAETIAKARAELLAMERLTELCKQLGLMVPTQLQAYPPPPAAPEFPPPPQPPCFLSRQHKERMAAQQQQPLEEVETKLDVKPRRLATTYLGPPGLLRIIGSGDEEHIIMRVVPGTDPLQDFKDDDPSQYIVIDEDTDECSDVDDLSEVSMALAGGIGKQEFQALLSDVAAQHQ